MISEKTFRLFAIGAPILYILRLIPFHWDPKTRRLKSLRSKSDEKLFSRLAQFHMLLRALFILYFVGTLLVVKNIPLYQVIIPMVLMIFAGSTIMLFSILLKHSTQQSFKAIANGILLLNEKQMEFHGMDPKTIDDPFRKVIPTFVGGGIVLTLLMIPSIYFILSQQWKILWLVNYASNFPTAKIVLGVMFSIIATVDWSLQFILFMGVFVYVYIGPLWLEKIQCKGAITSAYVKERFRIFFMAYHVMHRYLEELIYYVLPTVSLVATLNLILCVYALITMYDVLTPLIYSGVVLVTIPIFAGIAIPTHGAVHWTKCSRIYAASFQKLDRQMTRVDKSFFKAVRPIVWCQGPWLKVDEAFFPATMGFVVDWVIYLILESRN